MGDMSSKETTVFGTKQAEEWDNTSNQKKIIVEKGAGHYRAFFEKGPMRNGTGATEQEAVGSLMFISQGFTHIFIDFKSE